MALATVFRDRVRPKLERSLATEIMTDFAADSPHVLADLLMDADEAQFAMIYPKLKVHGDVGLTALQAEVEKIPFDHGPKEKETLAKRQANAAVALLKMNRPAKVWPLLKHSPDPRVRSYLVHWLGLLGADPGTLFKRLDEETDLTIRRALILSLGEFGEKEVPPEARRTLLPKLQDAFRNDADPGLHAAAEWLLRKWKQGPWLKQIIEEWARNKERRLDRIKQALMNEKDNTSPQWYVNGQGQTIVVVPGPVEFMMGSPYSEAGRQDNEPQHKKRIGRTFALSAKSVTVEQYRKFEEGYESPAVYTSTSELPVVRIDWYQAASYCNWLSEQEAIPEEQWCYETNPRGETGPNVQVVKLRANYPSLSGYRLPMEAEMEFAARAGAVTSRYYGEADELLPKYAWYTKNSQERMWPVGSLKPNDLGFFDVQGNVFTWCQENYQAYPQGEEVNDEKEDEAVISSTRSRVLRGGSFRISASVVRSAYRYHNVPSTRYDIIGFRLARALLLGSVTP
jgi:formylglycine-generating enzyme required for sulfatase activity